MSATSTPSFSFDTLRPLLLAEWPALDRAALDATGGDLDAVVALLVELTGQPAAELRQKVDDLVAVAGDSRGRVAAARLESALRRMEARANELRDRVKDDLVPEAEQKIKDNLLASLLIALGLGVILGLLMGGRRGR